MDIERFIKVLLSNKKMEKIFRKFDPMKNLKKLKLICNFFFSNLNFQNQMFDEILVHNASFRSCFLK